MISLLSKGRSRVFFSTTVRNIGAQLSLQYNSHIHYMTTGKTIALTIQILVSKVMSLLFNILSKFVISFLQMRKHLLTLWLQVPSAVILEPKK